MKKNTLVPKLFYLIFSLLSAVFAYAGSPLLSFLPITPTTIQVAANQSAIVQYTVTNRSSRAHTLMLVPISGVTQLLNGDDCSNPFTLSSKQSCTLTLRINGSQLSPIVGGPQVCQQGPDGKPSPMLCYQPSAVNSLKVTPIAFQTPILYVGTQNGLVYYSINDGVSWVTSNAPAGGSPINTVIATTTILYAAAANGTVYSSTNMGATWSAIATPAAGFSVNGLHVSANNKLYVASANGLIYRCALNGTECLPTRPPAAGFAVNGVFTTTDKLYAASENGSVYYSTNKGISWTAINGQPDGSAVNTVYVAADTLYVNTANEYVYTSPSLTGGGTWTAFAQTVYSLFVNANASQILAGNQSGHVFSLSLGQELGFVASTEINSVFLYE